MLGTTCPAPFAFDHVPPDARKFARLDPADIAQLVRLIQVEHQMAVVNSGGVIRDDQGTPWRRPCSLFLDLRLARPGMERGAKRRAFGSRNCHSRIIDKRCLMQCDMRAVGQFDRDRRVGIAHCRKRSLVVKILLSVPQKCRFPPCSAIACENKFGQFVRDVGLRKIWLFWKFVAETNAVFVQAESDTEHPGNGRRLFKMNLQFTVAVADCFPLSPRLRPAFVKIAHFLSRDGQPAVNLDGIGQKEAKLRRRKYRLAIACYGISRATIAIERNFNLDAAIG